ncbi:phosphatidylethanolamine-binding protein [Xylogone sp. PMI_703]|nr:phosphatidylethanolamine-binding protein [Xylogone sp. PMI_703]
MILNIKSRKLATLYTLLCSSLNFDPVHGRTPPSYSPSTSNTLNVTFNEDLSIYPGQPLHPTEAASIPTLAAHLDPFEPHIAFMIDIEIIQSGLAYPLLHWYQADLWVDNLTGESILRNLTDNGAAYVGPQPKPGPSHTYVILLFRQPLNYKFPPCFSDMLPLSIEARSGFDLHLFMKIAGLKDLLAANYFTSQEPRSRPTTTSLSRPPCATATGTGKIVTEELHEDL